MPSPIIPPNKIKQSLRGAKVVVGTMVVEIRQPSVMQLLNNAGFEFAIIDTEHGQFNIETIAELSRSARLLGVTPIVRVPEITYSSVTQPLDAGAQGIMIPRIKNPEQVLAALSMMKYPPAGTRGSVVSRGHTDFRAGDVALAMESANTETMLIVQIETREAIDNLDEILKVKGIDVALIGPNDLSISLGEPGNLHHPVLDKAIENTIAACRNQGVIPGIHMNDLGLAVQWTRRGMRMVSVNSEIGLLMNAGRETVTAIREALSPSS